MEIRTLELGMVWLNIGVEDVDSGPTTKQQNMLLLLELRLKTGTLIRVNM